MSNRASIFAPREDLDVSGFKPKAEPDGRPNPTQIDEVKSPRFRSREASTEGKPNVDGQPSEGQLSAVSHSAVDRQTASNPSPIDQPYTVGQQSTKRQPLVYRTGRNTTFSVKTTPETVDSFYEIARAQGWKAGETFERAIAALRREIG